MKYLKTFDEINEIAGGYRGHFGLPNWDDIKDILRGMSIDRVLAWTMPKNKSGSHRIALSATEIKLMDKKREILELYDCPEDYLDKKLTIKDISDWALKSDKV